MATSTVSSNDRLMFALFIALMLHAMIVLGISFQAEDPSGTQSSLNVTLSGFHSFIKPEKAEHIAQQNQEGSGTESENIKQTTDVQAKLNAPIIEEQVLETLTPSAPKTEKLVSTPTITTTANSRKISSSKYTESNANLPDGPTEEVRKLDFSLTKSLMADIMKNQQVLASKPKVKTHTATSAIGSPEAFYISNWRRQIEQIGKINFPPEARNCYNQCDLMLLVAINPDGSIHDIEIRRSSGNKTLDDAAVRIVRLASPFAPFTPEMRKTIDRLDIIRTWQYDGSNYFSGYN